MHVSQGPLSPENLFQIKRKKKRNRTRKALFFNLRFTLLFLFLPLQARKMMSLRIIFWKKKKHIIYKYEQKNPKFPSFSASSRTHLTNRLAVLKRTQNGEKPKKGLKIYGRGKGRQHKKVKDWSHYSTMTFQMHNTKSKAKRPSWPFSLFLSSLQQQYL